MTRTPDPIARLRALDPADRLVALKGERATTGSASQVSPGRAQKAWRQPLAAAAALAATAAATAAVLGNGAGPDLAERAYAATSIGPSRLRYESTVIDRFITDPAGNRRLDEHVDVERWTSANRVRLRYTTPQRKEKLAEIRVVGGQGRLLTLTKGGRTTSVRLRGDVASLSQTSRQGFVDRFRRYLDGNKLSEGGTVTFNGKQARVYTAKDVTGLTGEPVRVTYRLYLDASSGAPIGSVVTGSEPDGNRLEERTTVSSVKRLPLDPAGEALLRGPAELRP